MYRLFCFCVCILGIQLASAETELSGSISGTLKKVNSPYHIIGNIQVNEGDTLRIEPGVQILFKGKFSLIVEGFISAVGSSEDSIIFDNHTTNDGWYGIRINNSTDSATFTFKYVRFSGVKHLRPGSDIGHGLFYLDTIHGVQFSRCVFSNNQAFYGGCFVSQYSTISFSECSFINNKALDLKTSPPSGAYGPFGACIFAKTSNIQLFKCSFKGNVASAPNYTNANVSGEERAEGVVQCFGGKLEVNGCLFEDNHSELGSILYFGTTVLYEHKDTLILTNSEFRKNGIRQGGVLEVDGKDDKHQRAFITHCRFEENFDPLHSNISETVLFLNTQGSQNEIIFEDCILLNNDILKGVFFHNGSWVKASRIEIYGQKGLAVTADRNSRSYLNNSILANNWGGMTLFFGSDLDVVNSIIAYNGTSNAGSYPTFQIAGGVYISDRGRVNFYNSIISHNRGHLGQVANIVAINRSYFPGDLRSCILEGGIDSTYQQPISEPWFQEDTVAFSQITNVFTELPKFINPPKGYGVAYASEDLDFRLVQTCDPTPGFNKGLDHITGYFYGSFIHEKDLGGNPRRIADTMDIGPYELQGEKGQQLLYRPWRDTTLCSNNLTLINPHIIGQNSKYTFQYSLNGSTWKNVGQLKQIEPVINEPKDGWYRFIATQAECMLSDTFGPIKLNILPAPEVGLGADSTIKPEGSFMMYAKEGHASYVWNLPGADSSSKLFDAARLSLGRDSFLVWCEVEGMNGCIARDTIVYHFSNKISVDDLLAKELLCYPNPFKDVLHLRLKTEINEPINIRILSHKGELLLKEQYHAAHGAMDLHSLPPGLYIMIVESGNRRYTKRLLKTQM